MKYAVVIVNWNGADDTAACLASFVDGSSDAAPIVVDNGSTDGSVARLQASFPASRVMLVEAGENLGFAAACNLGLRMAQAAGLGVTVFLNNDTIVEPRALDRLVQRLMGDGNCFVCLPMLTVHGSDRIWNCGGALYAAGLRRYHLAGRPRADGIARGEIACTFFTGCCFAVRTAGFAARAGFSERFFFGEEDFELALWMKDCGLNAVCLTAAVVQHKVGASIDRASADHRSAKAFVHYLNRFIHMRLRFGRLRWCAWVAAYLPYVGALLLGRRLVRAGEMPAFIGALLRRATTMDRVTRADFDALMRGQFEPVPAAAHA